MNAAPPEIEADARAAGIHPSIVTARFFESWDFYTTLLGFRTTEENDGYVLLQHPNGAQLGLLQHELNGEWSDLVPATDGRGWWLTLEVDDCDALLRRARAAAEQVTATFGNEKWGGTRFALRDPNGVLIFVKPPRPKKTIAPEGELAAR